MTCLCRSIANPITKSYCISSNKHPGHLRKSLLVGPYFFQYFFNNQRKKLHKYISRPSWLMNVYMVDYLRPNKKNCCVALLEITFSGQVGRSEIFFFFFFFFFTHIPWVKVRAQNRICIANDDNQIVKAIFLPWNQRLKDLTQFLQLNWMIMC